MYSFEVLKNPPSDHRGPCVQGLRVGIRVWVFRRTFNVGEPGPSEGGTSEETQWTHTELLGWGVGHT